MKAVIFDMDGVIVDSEKYWNLTEVDFFKKIVPDWDDSMHSRIVGMCIPDIYKMISGEMEILVDEKEFMRRYDELAKKVYSSADLFPGMIETLTKINTPIALASSARKWWIDLVVERFDLRRYFKVILSVEDVGCAGKPCPDIYIATAKQLGVSPSECVVIEDSDNGIKAAKGAGMRCIGFKNGVSHAQTLKEADDIISSIPDVMMKLR